MGRDTKKSGNIVWTYYLNDPFVCPYVPLWLPTFPRKMVLAPFTILYKNQVCKNHRGSSSQELRIPGAKNHAEARFSVTQRKTFLDITNFSKCYSCNDVFSQWLFFVKDTYKNHLLERFKKAIEWKFKNRPRIFWDWKRRFLKNHEAREKLSDSYKEKSV